VHADATSSAVFLSLPPARTPGQEAVRDRLVTLLRREGLTIQRLPRDEYPPSDALSEIHRRMTGCAGAVVFGTRGTRDEPSEVATPWVHLEAGMAFGCNLPVLMVREEGVATGAFDDVVAGRRTFMLDLARLWDDEAVVEALRPWLSELNR
jgi:hypothetical protein